jgi:hypothetical protein
VLPEQAIRQVAAREPVENTSTGLLGSYDFTSLPSYRGQRNFLSPLGWTPEQPQFTSARASELDARSWLRTQFALENLTREIKKSNQFTVHIDCAPTAIEGANGRIVSLSQSADNVNFHLRQEGTYLVFWFRNPLSETRSVLAWTVPGAFEA